MTSVIRVGQSKFVTIPIDEDSQERIMNCLSTLSELKIKEKAGEVFLRDTKEAYSRMLHAQEVCNHIEKTEGPGPDKCIQKKAAEKKEQDKKKDIVQCDDLLTFRQFSKKAADDVIDVRTLFHTSRFKDVESLPQSTMQTWGGQPALRKSRKTSSQALAGYHNLLVRPFSPCPCCIKLTFAQRFLGRCVC